VLCCAALNHYRGRRCQGYDMQLIDSPCSKHLSIHNIGFFKEGPGSFPRSAGILRQYKFGCEQNFFDIYLWWLVKCKA
jgi:hypothetical protein